MSIELKYRKYTGPAEVDRALNTLKGIIKGITVDDQVTDEEIAELTKWCALQAHLGDRPPFNEIIPFVGQITLDGRVTEPEALDLLWLCDGFQKQHTYFDYLTMKLQELEGILHGMLADHVLSDAEIGALQGWMLENEELGGCYPFDELNSMVTDVLKDRLVTGDERQMLTAYTAGFANKTALTCLSHEELAEIKRTFRVDGLCAVCPQIQIPGRQFCFTGMSDRTTRSQFAQTVRERGGAYYDNVSANTDYLVIGNDCNPCWAFSCYGRRVEKAMKLRKKGRRLLIVHENDFWDALIG